MHAALIKILAFVVLHIHRPKPTALIQSLLRKTWIDMIEVADNGTELREMHTIFLFFFPKRLMKCCTTVKKEKPEWLVDALLVWEKKKSSSGNPCGREWLSQCSLLWSGKPEIKVFCYFSLLGLKDVLHNSLVPVFHTYSFILMVSGYLRSEPYFSVLLWQRLCTWSDAILVDCTLFDIPNK